MANEEKKIKCWLCGEWFWTRNWHISRLCDLCRRNEYD